jgi:hypothetical protein
MRTVEEVGSYFAFHNRIMPQKQLNLHWCTFCFLPFLAKYVDRKTARPWNYFHFHLSNRRFWPCRICLAGKIRTVVFWIWHTFAVKYEDTGSIFLPVVDIYLATTWCNSSEDYNMELTSLRSERMILYCIWYMSWLFIIGYVCYYDWQRTYLLSVSDRWSYTLNGLDIAYALYSV